MCKLKSAIILKDRVFMPDYDSHDKMLKELGIKDDYINASKTFVRAELSPKDGDVFTDIDDWEFNIDQDLKPDWFDFYEAKERMKKQLKEWAKTHIFYGIIDLKVASGENIYIKDCKNVYICGNATVKLICGNTTVSQIGEDAKVTHVYENIMIDHICEDAKVEIIRGSAKIDCLFNNAKVNYIYDDATINYICDNTKVNYIFDRAIVSSIFGDASINYIAGNTTVSNISGDATIRVIHENATVNRIHESATVNRICGNATVSSIYGNASVNRIHDNAKVTNIYDNATVKEDTYVSWKNINNVSLKDNAILISRSKKIICTAQEYKVQKYNIDKIKVL